MHFVGGVAAARFFDLLARRFLAAPRPARAVTVFGLVAPAVVLRELAKFLADALFGAVKDEPA